MRDKVDMSPATIEDDNGNPMIVAAEVARMKGDLTEKAFLKLCHQIVAFTDAKKDTTTEPQPMVANKYDNQNWRNN